MRATIKSGDLDIEVVGSASEIAEVLRDVVASADRHALPAPKAGEATASPKTVVDDGPGPLERTEVSAESSGGMTDRLIDPKTFFRDRNPTNHKEATAVAAYYLSEHAPDDERSPSITKEQLSDVFRRAQWHLPKRLNNTLVGTMESGYLNRISTGTYELSNTGHNLVVHTLGDSGE